MKRILLVFLTAILLAIGTNAAFEKVNTYNGNFSDVADTAWYAENVKTAYELGFMNGKGDGVFDPSGNVTVAEGIAMASRLHASYNDSKVELNNDKGYEHRLDFNDPDFLVNLNERNSRNNNGVTFWRADGKMGDGFIQLQPNTTLKNGNYDSGLIIEGLDLDARHYNKVTFRMKMDPLENASGKRVEDAITIFFKTNADSGYEQKKSVSISLKDVANTSEWFELSLDMFPNKYWMDVIRSIRFDTTSNNGIFYIDYIVFSSSENSSEAKWYELYYDYAVENGIIDMGEFSMAEMTRNITRSEMCALVASSLPNEAFPAINNIKGIPDISIGTENSDVFLMLYNAGILLGNDKEGTFNPASDIKRSEIAAIINRAALPENRVKGEISADWSEYACPHDIEFDDKKILSKISTEAKSIDVADGTLILESLQRANGSYDPRIIVPGLKIDAEKFTSIRVRMKAVLPEGTKNSRGQFFFMRTGDAGFDEEKSVKCDPKMDAAGWLVFTIDLRLNPMWDGEVSSIRFDPAGSAGTFYIDYIRFIADDSYTLKTPEQLINAGYSATRLMQDEHFERGFYVSAWDHSEGYEHGIWQDYCATTEEKPLWMIGPFWTKSDLIDDRDTTTDKYTLADKNGASTLTYNPEEKSMKMRVNATKIYNGEPYVYAEKNWWAHLLLEQTFSFAPVDKARNTAAADRMFVEMDIRCTDFKNTINPEGENTPSFLIYYYLMTDKAPGQKIWFGLRVFQGLNSYNAGNAGWSPDSALHQYMYGIPQTVIFGGLENCFNPEPGVVVVGDEWKNIRLDVTPHIKQAVEWANRDNIFGVPVTVEDMYFGGVNIGFETWGNFDYTFEFKNFNMVAYNK